MSITLATKGIICPCPTETIVTRDISGGGDGYLEPTKKRVYLRVTKMDEYEETTKLTVKDVRINGINGKLTVEDIKNGNGLNGILVVESVKNGNGENNNDKN